MRPHVSPESLSLPVFGGLRVDLRDFRGALSSRPIAPEAGGVHAPILGLRGAAGRRGAAAADSAAVVSRTPTDFHGIVASRDCATAFGKSGGCGAGPCHRARYFFLDGCAFGESHLDGCSAGAGAA